MRRHKLKCAVATAALVIGFAEPALATGGGLRGRHDNPDSNSSSHNSNNNSNSNHNGAWASGGAGGNAHATGGGGGNANATGGNANATGGAATAQGGHATGGNATGGNASNTNSNAVTNNVTGGSISNTTRNNANNTNNNTAHGGAGGAGGNANNTNSNTANGGAGGMANNANTNAANNTNTAQGGAGGLGGAGGAGGAGGMGGAGGTASNANTNSADNSSYAEGGSSSADNNGNNNGNNNSSSSNSQQQQQQQQLSNNSETSNANNSSQEVNVNTYNQRAPVNTAFAAPLMTSEDTCMGSSSLGAQAVTFGLSIGTTWRDSNCRRLKNSRQLVALGYVDAATQLMCQDDEVREAMDMAGTPCPTADTRRATLQPTAAPVVQAPPVPAPCPTTDFVVYFDWDRANLNREANDTIDAAVARARSCGARDALVIGHTDTSGSRNYNVELSQRRSAVVRDALIARGIEAGVIRTESRGELDLARQTRDGVRDPLNRRTAVTISFR